MMLIAYLLGAGAFIAGIGLTISSGWLITMASMQPPILTLSVAIVLVRFFGIFRSAARYGERLMSHRAVFSALTGLRVGIYRKLSHSSIALAHTVNGASAVKSIVDDVERAQEYQLRIKLPKFSAIISLVFALLLAFWIRPESIFITVPICLLLLFIIPALIASRCEPIARTIEGRENIYNQILEGSINGATEAAIYGYLDENRERAADAGKEIRKGEEGLLRLTWGFASISNLLIAFSIVAFAWLAMTLAHSHAIPGVQITMLIFIPLVMFEAITSWYPNLFNAGKLLMSQHSVDALMNLPVEPEFGHPIDAPIKRVKAENLTVKWNQEFMTPISFEVLSGELMVIRGRSGSGKSTLVMGLLGLLPHTGSLTCNEIELQGISNLNNHIVGTVQHSHIFNTSLRENLRISNQAATDEQIIHVLKLVELDHLLIELGEGLDTTIGEFGRIISGGEAKRLSVARALLAPADCYIFDEPTEHLDEELALRVEAAIRKFLAQKIVIVVTHSGWLASDKTLIITR